MRCSSGSLTGRTTRLAALPALALMVLGTLNLAGCPQPSYQQMFPDATLKSITNITSDSSLTTDQKTQQLQDLGIDDDQVIFLLINGPKPTSS